ncbi:MAG: uracil-DNA glycosylase [Desulfobulbaceae bacterium]|nr:uracil-DNA glycosylase [Desulfobulbaceae bacterium]
MPDNAKSAAKAPNCFHCRHFFITHQLTRPYGCRAMGFKSLQMPAIAVRTSSGMECQLFSAKEPRGSQP